jgi:predicted 2-oxoglutarate/Fe(II)-dependent dioxygenase YbiX
MVRGHDHVEERYAIYPAYRAHPLLTTVALSRRLSREIFGSYERVPTIAQHVEGALPRVYRLHIPADMIREVYPDSHPNGIAEEAIQELHK